jgi:SOS-response transcriptional repressor LexA
MVGDSMVHAGILAGDTLVFRQSSARDGDIVLAAVGDELAVKRLRKRARRVVLEPENPDFAPMTFAPGAVRVVGVLVRLVREYACGVPMTTPSW